MWPIFSFTLYIFKPLHLKVHREYRDCALLGLELETAIKQDAEGVQG